MRIAVSQMCSGIDPDANAVFMIAQIAEAAANQAKMIFFPEMCGLLDSKRPRARRHIGPERDSRLLSQLRQAAQEQRIWLHIGSLAMDDGRADQRLSNRGFVVDEQGVIRAHYDKIHLFDVSLPTGEAWRESASYAPGAQAVVTQTPIGRLGLTICYDLRFPALFSALSDAGAEIISVPAAFTVPTGEAHWHSLLRARAVENACYIVASAQFGHHEDGRKTFGHSLVVDPWGEILLELEDVGLGYADIDLSCLAEVRQRIPVLEHRRPIPHVIQQS